MSKKFKAQASSSRAAGGGFGVFGGFSSAYSSAGKGPSSLTFVAEPPDLTRISDQELVIAFKNLQKKDEITRGKALDDLRDFVSAAESRGDTLDDAFLDAWVKIYPRISIDLSRKVRQTAQFIQGCIASVVGKRIARYLPKIIGAWLAGLYDNDRLVSRSTFDSFTRVFASEDKRNTVWKIYQSSILDFVNDVVLQQTPLTLSDERSTKPDDAEAKYVRTVGTALLLLSRILGNTPYEDLRKDYATIETLLKSKSLWSFCFHEDPFVRRAVYALLRSAASSEFTELNWKAISSALIGKSMSVVQTGSATELSECLLEVTSSRPQLWTDEYSGKSSSAKRLLQYIRKGSQGASNLFWTNLAQLLQTVPAQVLAVFNADGSGAQQIKATSVSTLLDAYLDGINSKDEPRQNLVAAWKSFLEVVVWLSPKDNLGILITRHVSPLFENFAMATQHQSPYTLPPQWAEAILVHSFAVLVHQGVQNKLKLLWIDICAKLIDAVKISAPEQSKDFHFSQDRICAQAKRLFTLEAAISTHLSDTEHEEYMLNVFQSSNIPLLESCLQILRSRKGKPYGAAAVAEEAICNVPLVVKGSTELVTFVQNDAPALLFSPSGDRLVSVILACRDWPGFEAIVDTVVNQVLELKPDQSSARLLPKLLSTVDLEDLKEKARLRSMIARMVDAVCNGSGQYWPVILAVLHNQTSHGALTDFIFLSLINALSTESTAVEALNGLSQIAFSEPLAVQRFQSGAHGSKLAEKLLFLAESPDETLAILAESLLARLIGSVAGEMRLKSNLELLQRSLMVVNDESLSIECLVKLAVDLLEDVSLEERSKIANDILPTSEAWEKALCPFLALPPRSSTAITSSLGGVVHLVEKDLSDTTLKKIETVPRDSEHHSFAFRLISYTTQLLASNDLVETLSKEKLDSLFYYMPLAVQLVDDNLSIQGCNRITVPELPEQRDDSINVVSLGRQLMQNWINSTTTPQYQGGLTISSFFSSSWENKLDGLEGTSPLEYRIGEAFVKIMMGLQTLHKIKSSDNLTKLCKESRTSNVISSAAWLAVMRDQILRLPAGTRLCNELLADCTGIRVQDQQTEGLRKLAFLNILLSGEQDMIPSIPTQRLVFLIKHLTQCLQSDVIWPGLKSEIFRILTIVLPHVSDVYGSHWEDLLEILSASWRATSGSDDALPVLESSYRLFACLKSTAEGKSNDDVQDAWSHHKSKLYNDLMSTLDKFDSETAWHQPRDVTVELLCRFVGKVPIENLENVGKFFPLLTANSLVVQRAAFEILHRYIPKVQEQVSFDVALSKAVVKLPDELLSLLLEPPTMESLSKALAEDAVWNQLRSYLLSWKVVFDHLSNASLAVQEYYVSNLKENDFLPPLLDFTSDFLQKSNGKFIDASKFDVRFFQLGQSETLEMEMRWLLVHLYFLSLKFLSNMSKNWWLDTKKRIKGPVEAWTQKYISPLVIEDALHIVSDWEFTQDPSEERALSLKISPKTAEIIASIPVDEESPPVAISIALPPTYPLQPAVVTGRSRVLVDEKKWRSWLLTIQGVIMFANGNLVDGLMAFRRNVQGALKGQSECAICYSVVSTDMQTPNKRCATCKNTFHSVCLFRWFKSSNQSTCPLCRNNFVYV